MVALGSLCQGLGVSATSSRCLIFLIKRGWREGFQEVCGSVSCGEPGALSELTYPLMLSTRCTVLGLLGTARSPLPLKRQLNRGCTV